MDSMLSKDSMLASVAGSVSRLRLAPGLALRVVRRTGANAAIQGDADAAVAAQGLAIIIRTHQADDEPVAAKKARHAHQAHSHQAEHTQAARHLNTVTSRCATAVTSAGRRRLWVSRGAFAEHGSKYS